MRKSPLPLKEILEYLRLEDVEGLVIGSVKYVGHIVIKNYEMHYWSYPENGKLQWACWDGYSLGFAEMVPPTIQAKTLPLELHRTQQSPAPPKHPWIGGNISQTDTPRWVPASKVRCVDIGYVGEFLYDFNQAAATFHAKPTTDKYNGGAGPCRYFLLELSRNKLAMLTCEERHPDRIKLYLPDKEGLVYWEDYDQVMNPLGVSLEKAFRQGGLKWKHRKRTPEAIERTRDHYKRIWIPENPMIGRD